MDLSVPAQLKAIRKYCQDKGWSLVSEYIDEAKSAKTADRPNFQRMVALAKKSNRHFDAIIVHKFDRFSRSREDHVIYKALLKKHGVTVLSVTEQTDPDTPHGFLLEGMLEVISEFYNLNLANETRKGMVENAKRGFHNGGNAPYGYRNHRFEQNGAIKATWVLGPDQEVETVQRIFHLYAYEGYGYKRIAGILNEEGIPAPTKKGWSYTTIWHILHNESYLGIRVWNKQDYKTPGKKYKAESEWIKTEKAHPAIVSQEVFDLVKKKAEERNKVYPGFRTGQSPYILRGLLFCPKCGGKMVSGQSGSKKGSKQNVRKYYVCGNYQRKGKVVCEFMSLPKEKAEKAIVDHVCRELLVLSIPGSLEDVIRSYRATSNEWTQQLLLLDADITAKEKYLDLLRNDTSLLSHSLEKHIEELANEISQLRARRDEIAGRTLSDPLSEQTIQTLRQQMRNQAEQLTWGTPDMKHNLLRLYLARIDVSTAECALVAMFTMRNPVIQQVLCEKTLITSFC
jgi:DNA invertase Pin-like site-specific DNA recombinase